MKTKKQPLTNKNNQNTSIKNTVFCHWQTKAGNEPFPQKLSLDSTNARAVKEIN